MKRLFIILLVQGAMLMAFSQNVGIGTTAPAEKLHVAGNIKGDTVKPNAIKFFPNAGNGKVLTSDATGNASWQTSSAAAGNIGYGVWDDCATNGNISEYNPLTDADGAASDYFGSSVLISGNHAIVGAFADDVGANTDQGSAIIYQRIGLVWKKLQYVTDPSGDPNDIFGISAGIDGTNRRFIIGAPYVVGFNGNVVFGKIN